MSLIKRHKGLAIVGGLTLILIAVLFVIFARMIFSTGETEYGKRLDGVVKIDKGVLTEIKEEIKKSEQVEDITIRTQGKIIYTTIKFKEGTKEDKAKQIAESTVLKYSEEVLDSYDLGYFLKENIEVKEDEEKNGFTIAGTKHPDNEKISWTKK